MPSKPAASRTGNHPSPPRGFASADPERQREIDEDGGDTSSRAPVGGRQPPGDLRKVPGRGSAPLPRGLHEEGGSGR